MSDRKVLDYHDVLLYAGDVELLRGPQWLNDQAGGSFFLNTGKALTPLNRYRLATVSVSAGHSILFRVLRPGKVFGKGLGVLPRMPDIPPAPVR